MIEYALLVAGLVLLVKGADFLVEGSSSLARKLGISTLVVGLTVVSFGTSMPELIVNIFASFRGSGDIALGNIIGSNMANILLGLGLVAALVKLKVHHSTVWKEIPFALLSVVVLLVFAGSPFIDGIASQGVSRGNAIVLLLFFSIFLYYVFELSKRQKYVEKSHVKEHSLPLIAGLVSAGILALYFGGRLTVDGASSIASSLGLSEFLISATVIAVGTSLPELVTSVTAAMKKDVDLAVGNVVGSNIFNIFFVLGVTGIIRPVAFPSMVFIDIFILLVVTLSLFAFMFVGRTHELERYQGVMFVLVYAAYLAYLIQRG